MPGHWEMPSGCQLLPSLSVITDICNILPGPGPGPSQTLSIQHLVDHHQNPSTRPSWGLQKKAPNAQAVDQGHRASQVEPDLGTFFLHLQRQTLGLSIWKCRFINGPPTPRPIAQTDRCSLVSSHIVVPGKSEPSLLAKSSRTPWSILTKVSPGGGSLAMSPLFTLLPMGEACYHRAGSVPN